MNEREFHSKSEADFFAYLKNLGFPDGSLIFEPSVKIAGKIYSPDFLIVDPDNNERLAVIEVKRKFFDRSELVKEQLNTYRNAIGNTTIPAFLATPSEDNAAEHPFKIFKLRDDGEFEKIDLSLFPSFFSLSSNKAAEKKKEISDKKEGITSSFETVTRWTVVSLIALVIADFVCSFFNIKILTTERLTLFGGAVALLIIPYAQKFKWLGIEWEQASTKKDK